MPSSSRSRYPHAFSPGRPIGFVNEGSRRSKGDSPAGPAAVTISHGLTAEVCALAGFSVSVSCSGCGKTSGAPASTRPLLEIWSALRCSDCGSPIQALDVTFRPGSWGRDLDILRIRRDYAASARREVREAVCNDYKLRLSIDEIARAFSETRIPLRFPEGSPNLEPRDDVRITDMAPVVRSAPDGEAELVLRRWSWPGPGGKPVYNFRSEGRKFTKGRCLIPADAFYEFTDPDPPAPKRARKTKWAFSSTTEPWLCIAGVLRKSDAGEAFAMLTIEPGADIAPYHDRQVVVLQRPDWAAWLLGGENEDRLLRPSTAGALRAQQEGAPGRPGA